MKTRGFPLLWCHHPGLGLRRRWGTGGFVRFVPCTKQVFSFLLMISLFERQSDRALLSNTSFPKWLQWLLLGQAEARGPETPYWSPAWVAGTQVLAPSAVFPDAGLEAEQPGLEPALLTVGAGFVISGLTCTIIILAPIFKFLMMILIQWLLHYFLPGSLGCHLGCVVFPGDVYPGFLSVLLICFPSFESYSCLYLVGFYPKICYITLSER